MLTNDAKQPDTFRIESRDQFSYVVRQIPEQCTAPGRILAEEIVRFERLINCFTFDVPISAAITGSSSFLEGLKSFFALFKSEEVDSDIQTFSGTLKSNMTTLAELVYSRAVDSFSYYLINLLSAILRSRPEMLKMLKSERQLTYSEVLNCTNYDDLIEYMIEREARSSDREALSKLVDEFDKYGVPIFISETEKHSVIRISQARNLLVHSNGIVDERYIKHVSDTILKIGDRIDISEIFHPDIELLTSSAFGLDERAAKKFKLELFPLEREAFSLKDDLTGYFARAVKNMSYASKPTE
jgi:hypothetical protein